MSDVRTEIPSPRKVAPGGTGQSYVPTAFIVCLSEQESRGVRESKARTTQRV
jgi:hypothetical protein